MPILNIEEIFKILPQRFPFLMIDRVTELEPGKKIVALKNVSANDDFIKGHFPGNPIMPGALIIEAMAQAAIILFHSPDEPSSAKKPTYYLSSVKVRFLHPVLPGDQIEIVIEPVKVITQAAIVNAEARVKGQKVAGGEISFMAKEST
ncbi:MAG: 3-hydroxyacyl-ACP dehydratase FabZ [Candidatus Omnitrophica bacterium]|nr:3-hydroxyacyl-ACP dehydratase FabZ [Candidatus Omnitrophota bacterium]MDD5610275.1 3-hydroxyacyl-ACP dehydratase FabZ [Candidatus Omnitrophota bacterium]